MTLHLTRRRALAGLAGAFAAPALIGRATAPARAAAPMQEAAAPAFRRYKIGGFEVTTLLDGSAMRDGPHPIFGADQPAEAVAELMRQSMLPEMKVQFYFTPTLVNTGAELVLFDTGNAPANRPGVGNTQDQLKAAGYTPDQVDIVVITHFHPDHIGGVMTDGAPTYPNARYVTGSTEHNLWDKIAMDDPENGAGKVYTANLKPLLDKFTFIEPGAAVVSGVTAVESFGHTLGHLSFMLESAGAGLLVWGDIANHFVASIERPDWHVSFDMDKEMAVATRKRIFDMVSADHVPVVAYHSPFPAVGLIEAKDGGYRWIPESYQIDAMNAG
jgi:glyoxylase-like metal-dependent hydrolase (beta-lactamase superfamily II)